MQAAAEQVYLQGIYKHFRLSLFCRITIGFAAEKDIAVPTHDVGKREPGVAGAAEQPELRVWQRGVIALFGARGDDADERFRAGL